MKNIFFILIAFFLIGCRDSSDDITAKLPPETQIGANTFGCLVNGRLFYPRDGIGDVMSVANAISYFGSSSNTYDYNEMTVANFIDGKPMNYLYFHLHDLPNKGVGLAREEFIINNYIQVHPLALMQHEQLGDDELSKEIKLKILFLLFFLLSLLLVSSPNLYSNYSNNIISFSNNIFCIKFEYYGQTVTR